MGTDRLHFCVLKRREEIASAERALRERGLQPRPGALDAVWRLARRPGAASNLAPDPIKSWDVLRTIEAVESLAAREDAVLDVGAVGSAILPALHRLGFASLHGIDLNPQVTDMAHAREIEYAVGDLTATPWPDGRFAAVTAISVIEHGVDEEALFGEVARLLRPGGAFVFSTDYWPEKIDTSDERLFDLPWRIFSADEVGAFVERARGHGLVPASDPHEAIRDVLERPINYAGRNYTFLHGALLRAG